MSLISALPFFFLGFVLVLAALSFALWLGAVVAVLVIVTLAFCPAFRPVNLR